MLTVEYAIPTGFRLHDTTVPPGSLQGGGNWAA